MARTKPTAAQIAAAAVAARDRAIINQILNDGGSISSLSQTAPPRPASVEILCRYGARCYRPDCKFKHPTAYVAQAPACRDGWHCTRPGCGFTHPPGVRDRIELPSGLRRVLLDQGGRILKEIRRRVPDARVDVVSGETVACLVDVEAASAGALEQVLEYLAWTRHAVVSRGLQMDKMPGLGLVAAVLQKEKRRETGRKLTKGQKKACKREAAAYMTPPVEPRFFDPAEWDSFVAPRAPRVPPTETKVKPKRIDFALLRECRAASRKRRRDYDGDDYGSAGEETRRQRGLETPIDASNKGYQLLRKMGYDGGGLGKDGAGMVDPLATETRKPRDTQGVGIPQAARRAQLSWEAARRHVEQRERADFAQHNQRRFSDRACLKAARRARSACRDLDERNGLRWTPIWPSDEAHPQRSFADASGAVYAQPGTYLETGQNDGIGGLDEEAPEVALRTAVAYLRDCHGYCLVHGCTLDDGSPDLEAELAELVDDAED